jgi:hypothetical protein
MVVLFSYFTWAGFLRRVMNFWAKALGPAFYVLVCWASVNFCKGPMRVNFLKFADQIAKGERINVKMNGLSRVSCSIFTEVWRLSHHIILDMFGILE